jgi:uncharacterized protein (DUF952 family)
MPVYKICEAASWDTARAAGHFAGSVDDVRDGFLHLSTAGQTPGTLAKHFAGRADLIIAAVDETRLGKTLKWEASRGGALFPHIYGVLPMTAVLWWKPLPLMPTGGHALPNEVI